MTVLCDHVHVVECVCDQTLGVACVDCNTLLAWCWSEDHVPESLWNRAVKADINAKVCEHNRDDVCAICGSTFLATKSEQ
jgi:hypothetical protein